MAISSSDNGIPNHSSNKGLSGWTTSSWKNIPWLVGNSNWRNLLASAILAFCLSVIENLSIFVIKKMSSRQIFHLPKTVFFSQLASWKRNHNKYSLKKSYIRNSRKWNYLMSPPHKEDKKQNLAITGSSIFIVFCAIRQRKRNCAFTIYRL